MKTRRRALAVAAIATAALGGMILPATAASAATAQETRVFQGFSFNKDDPADIAIATDRARASATASANSSGFFNCPTEQVWVFENPSPGLGTVDVTVTLTCVR